MYENVKADVSMKTMMKMLVAGVALTAMAAAPAQAKTLVNGIDAAFPPFAYVDKDGEAKGFDVDSLNWIAKEMGFEVKHQAVAWEGIIPSLVAEKIDFICSGMSITEKRQEQVDFTDPYWQVKNVFVAKADSTLTVDEVLKGGKKIGMQQGTAEDQWLSNARKEPENKDWNYTKRQYSAAAMAIGDVLNGRIDAAGMDTAPANDAIKNGMPIKIVGAFGTAKDYGCAVRKTDPELLKMLNEGYKRLMASPKWEELKAKYKP
jgi:polar amino acid transport system substrate-binding protein